MATKTNAVRLVEQAGYSCNEEFYEFYVRPQYRSAILLESAFADRIRYPARMAFDGKIGIRKSRFCHPDLAGRFDRYIFHGEIFDFCAI